MKYKFLCKILLSLLLIANVKGQEDDGIVEESSEPTVEATAERKQYVKPFVSEYYFLDTFEEEHGIGTKWFTSKAKKNDVDDEIAKYDGLWSIEPSFDSVFDGDLGLVLKSKAKHHAISSRLTKPFVFTNKKPLVIQYEVKFQTSLECGGAYAKMLEDTPALSLEQFHDKSSFSIMFGPDKCGTDSKYHFIVRFKNPVKGTFEEKHAKKGDIPDHIFSDGKTHLYTLIVRPDNTFHMYIDRLEVNSGSLLKDLSPPIIPDKEIVDPKDAKPESWDDREKIPDPDASKPEDWDESEPKTIPDPEAFMPEGWLENEPETIPDPVASKPEDWDEETDGDWEAPRIENPECKNAVGCGKWEAPQISNPKYKGKWKVPLIDNVSYQGKWVPKKIANPDYFEIESPFESLTSFSAIGLELWSMTENIYFDNFIVGDSEEIVEQFTKDTWALKKSLESVKTGSSDSVFSSLKNATEERPWLWAIYLLVVLLPVVLIVVFCCFKSTPADNRAVNKKTDEPTEDDKPEEDNENQESEKDEDSESATTSKPSKGDLEEVSKEEADEAEESTKKSPTKRKPRKD